MNDRLRRILGDTEAKSVTRCGFTLKVAPERLPEYLEAHQSVWEDMRDALSRTGWKNYSLFVDVDTGDVFGYFESDDVDTAIAAMGDEDINTRWQAEMAKYFASPDGGDMKVLPQYFYLQ